MLLFSWKKETFVKRQFRLVIGLIMLALAVCVRSHDAWPVLVMNISSIALLLVGAYLLVSSFFGDATEEDSTQITYGNKPGPHDYP